MMVDPLTTDQWVLLPLTVVLIPTLWLECQWGLVRVMESGAQQQLQCVRVRNDWMCNNVYVECVPVPIVITCSDLPSLTNGDIDYGGAGSTSSRPMDTVATHTCNTGYTLSGGSTTRTCGSDRMWSGLAPVCQRKWNELWTVCLLSVLSPIQLTALTYPHRPMGWLCTVLDLLTTYLSSLVLCTLVTLATLSLARTCVSGGIWDGSAPTCQREFCNSLFLWEYTGKPN